jgi:hypothetical protein
MQEKIFEEHMLEQLTETRANQIEAKNLTRHERARPETDGGKNLIGDRKQATRETLSAASELAKVKNVGDDSDRRQRENPSVRALH